MFKITANTKDIQLALTQLSSKIKNLKPALNQIGYHLLEVTEDAFQSETSPFSKAWKDLAPATFKAKQKSGHIKKLQNTGTLASSLNFYASSDHLILGTNLEYAPIHQFGGKAGRNHSAKIPARPFLPIDIDGNLPSQTEQEIISYLQSYLLKK